MAFLALVLVVLLADASPVSAQAVSGTLLGTITDSESLPIPGASITITEVNTNIKTVGVTNADGNFVSSSIRNGVYRVEAELTGFRKAVRPPQSGSCASDCVWCSKHNGPREFTRAAQIPDSSF